MKQPTPSKSYKQMQHELRLVSKANGSLSGRTKLENALEKMFMTAWGFTKDRLRLSYKLQHQLQTTDDGALDHCKHYSGPNDERVIVTQPYGDFANQLKIDFMLDHGVAPEVIEASEWAFYYPGDAPLVILIFPSDYAQSLEKCHEQRRKRDIAARLQQARKQAALMA